MKLRIKKASNSQFTQRSVARSYQHKAIGELHRQKGILRFSVKSIDTFLPKVQVR